MFLLTVKVSVQLSVVLQNVRLSLDINVMVIIGQLVSLNVCDRHAF